MYMYVYIYIHRYMRFLHWVLGVSGARRGIKALVVGVPEAAPRQPESQGLDRYSIPGCCWGFKRFRVQGLGFRLWALQGLPGPQRYVEQ